MMSTAQRTLLVELLTEELPPKALARLGDAFADGIANGLRARGLVTGESVVTPYATPRRLAVSISNVLERAPDATIRAKVLPVSVALDANGNPTPPLAKKLAAMGFADLPLASLERAMDGKAEAFFHTYTAAGARLADALQAALDETLGKLPIPKVMSYQRPDGETVQFVRPVHGLIALHGETIVPATAIGLTSSNKTQGHRFLSRGEVVVANADAYAATLESEGKVLASFTGRRDAIREQLLATAGSDHVVMPDALLDEVTALVEWPAIYACHFEKEFLAVPQECLILTMQTNQKYFALTDKPLAEGGRLTNRFLIVSNIATAHPEQIITGNERVVRPRLADAKFFFEQDKKKTLAERVPQLANVVYHNKLGSQLARTERLVKLAGAIAQMLGGNLTLAELGDETAQADDRDRPLTELAQRGALLAKADLLTDMVGEFPELQGTMGTYYARHDNEPSAVALACSAHYQPRFAGDALPAGYTGTVVALADKLETLVGIWGIGLQPTGEKDPFALRRHALGVVRMLVEKRLPLMLRDLLKAAYAQFASGVAESGYLADVEAFVLDRLRGYLRERGYAANDIEAVLAHPHAMDASLGDLLDRLEAVRAFSALPQAEALAAANKRIGNILKKTAHPAEGKVHESALVEPAEIALHAALQKVTPELTRHSQAHEYTQALSALAQLRDAVDAFFNDVMVMAEDETLRNNRLALLWQLHVQMNQVADLSKLAA
ncbi:glycine--tRNA ligase subunit beta [Pandoraea nosoerga]|uniref:Glycine--tRNA ligase beta subunit n=1 Tax=Pandoraea nosoerga TaxID=2508296 RepID=A0A5E4TEI3_9BURK|nr:glycine--tRNA ligase subunit beta [Pandoraea nosoerga]MBN4664171.1 glycine--tRNA ligase subunit beta [Pandoraea nosoerga]MBN4675420.1 glycine--tRNA ligase subunit beta [Pandoraea nosoerga]MBN4679258.1 glycine--tRNA ligase subunit beta [Pandoraea nosoerga]MBN4743744.1 glycine--tRNA ligase subunit beta [Pandoraea nosoerga]VVD84968.1 glycine--tRNA ligase subunit beta [Pandoraea nosoerga]